MHHYGIDNHVRETVTRVLILVSFILGFLLHPVFEKVFKFICDNFAAFDEVMTTFEFAGFYTPVLTSYSAYWTLEKLYETHLWKNKLLMNWHKIPNLNGDWGGGLTSSYTSPDTGENSKISMSLKIEQTWSKISCVSFFDTSQSKSDVAWILPSPNCTELKFAYTNKSSDVTLGLPQYDGYNILTLSGENTISGRYFTTRPPNGTNGTFFLTRVPADAVINETVSGNSSD